ncbi:MAG: SRPBCC domain-containing protein, partial [bacterium]
MSEYGSVIEQGTVRFERVLPGPIERVWAYLTDAELRGTWFASGPMELRAGGKAELYFDHANLAPPGEVIPEKHKAIEGGITMTMRIARCEPPRVLAYTWD